MTFGWVTAGGLELERQHRRYHVVQLAEGRTDTRLPSLSTLLAATAITRNRFCFLAPLSVASFPSLSADIWVFSLHSSSFRQQPSNFARTCRVLEHATRHKRIPIRR